MGVTHFDSEEAMEDAFEEQMNQLQEEYSMDEECHECSGYGSCTDEDGSEETCEACQGSGAMPGTKAYEEHCYGDR